MNFSTSNIWNNSFILRYPLEQIKKIGNLYFYESENILKCQHFFEFDITNDELKIMQKEIKNNKKIRFNYINDSVLSNKLKEWAIKNNFEYQKTHMPSHTERS